MEHRLRTRHGAALAEGLLGCGCLPRLGVSLGSRCCPEEPHRFPPGDAGTPDRVRGRFCLSHGAR